MNKNSDVMIYSICKPSDIEQKQGLNMFDVRSVESGETEQDTDTMSVSTRRRRLFQRQACLLSVMAAFSLGVALGVFIPLMGMSSDITEMETSQNHNFLIINSPNDFQLEKKLLKTTKQGLRKKNKLNSVSFVTDEKLKAEEVFRNAFHLEQQQDDDDTMIVKKLDPEDGSIKEFTVQRTLDGYFRKGPEVKISKPSIAEEILSTDDNNGKHISVEFVQHGELLMGDDDPDGVLKDDIFWGPTIENAIPKGFDKDEAEDWNNYVDRGVVIRLEAGCGRMQNRMVIFEDGKRACARYRQNTDQIQGELFSFYLGQLLNLTNLAPSTASIIDLNTDLWSSAAQDISSALWKDSRPVVLTKWVPDLEPAGIPLPFQPLERHLNKLDVRNITLGLDTPKPQRGLLDRLGAAKTNDNQQQVRSSNTPINDKTLSRLIELAQWSDLIVFDYLIANLDRVVNNLYNFQWNADIMAAPAHNLARQSDSQLLVFLDNESGLLHGYRLLKKYEAYHGLLLDNLCVFRQPTIDALQKLRDHGVGKKLQNLFEKSTSLSTRDVLPPLPDKSIKILIDRIDRVLGQVQKCRELFSSR